MQKFIVLILLVLSSSLVFSQQNEKYIIIIGGGMKYSDADKAKNNYLKIIELKNQIFSTIEIVKSDTIKGLIPDFYFAVLGYVTDEYRASLICVLANKHMNLVNIHDVGVYKKKVFLKNKYSAIRLKIDFVPFIAQKFDIQKSQFSALIDIDGQLYDKNIEDFKTVYVKTDKVIFEKQKGLITLKYYIAWVEQTNEIIYLNQFQFTRLFVSTNEWEKDCEDYVDSVEYPESDFSYTVYYIDCNYNNGVKYSRDTGYEWDDEKYSFPISKFSFDEVFAFYIDKFVSYGVDIFNISLSEINEDGIYENGYYNLTYIPGKEICFEEPGGWMGIKIEKGYIIFYEGGGA